VSQQTQTDQRDLELLARLAKARGEIAAQIGQRRPRAAGRRAGPGEDAADPTIAQALTLEFSRIQFTPDLMPSDITGTELLQEDKTTGKRVSSASRRARSSPTSSSPTRSTARPAEDAGRAARGDAGVPVTVGRPDHVLPEPFFVLATQNPIEQEGTYPLPEAQLDRFMFELRIGYPSADEEEMIVSSTTGVMKGDVKPVLPAETIREMQRLVRRIPAPPSLVSYAVGLARATRPDDPSATALVKKYVSFGAGPRAGQNLVLGAKSRAAMDGRSVPDLEDVDAVAFSVLRHRVVMNFQAEAEGVGSRRCSRSGDGAGRAEAAFTRDSRGAECAGRIPPPFSVSWEGCRARPVTVLSAPGQGR
jgi:MoxR-like ATPase